MKDTFTSTLLDSLRTDLKLNQCVYLQLGNFLIWKIAVCGKYADTLDQGLPIMNRMASSSPHV